MPYFNIHREFLVDSYELSLKEKEKIDKFLQILDEADISKYFEPKIKKYKFDGGRPSTNYCKLFAEIAYGFSKCDGSLRKLEELMKYDLRFIYLMDQENVSAATISRFCNNYVVADIYIQKKVKGAIAHLLGFTTAPFIFYISSNCSFVLKVVTTVY